MKPANSRRRSKILEDLLAEHAKDPDCLKNREQARIKAVAASLEAAKPVRAELASRGFMVDTISDLFNRRMNYKDAVPVLLKWLPRVSDTGVKRSLISALAVSWARPAAAAPLIREFRGSADTTTQWFAGNALSVVADDSVFDEVVQLVTDPRFGEAREMLAVALGNMRNPRAAEVLIRLLSDEEVVGHAVMGLRKLKAVEARSAIEKLASHPKTWIRTEVKKALAKFDAVARKESPKKKRLR
jgi:HEAT repeat protein